MGATFKPPRQQPANQPNGNPSNFPSKLPPNEESSASSKGKRKEPPTRSNLPHKKPQIKILQLSSS